MSRSLTIGERYQRARESGRPLLGGHRGNPEREPENTLASFSSALDLGVDLVECDVHLSADDRLVVIHDPDLDRTTDGTGPVRALPWERLRRLDAGRGERLPLLAELIGLVRGRAGLVIELKEGREPYPRYEELLLRELSGAGVLGDSAAISFNHAWIRRLKEMEPRLYCGILEVTPSGDPVALLAASGADFYSPHHSAASAQLVAAVHRAGRHLGVWTVDEPGDLPAVLAAGVDSVFTNRPGPIGRALRGLTSRAKEYS